MLSGANVVAAIAIEKRIGVAHGNGDVLFSVHLVLIGMSAIAPPV